jgi:hypothetical protein
VRSIFAEFNFVAIEAGLVLRTIKVREIFPPAC